MIHRDISYHNYLIVNEEVLKTLDNQTDSEDDQIYVFAQFMKPGRKTYVTSLPQKARRRIAERTYFVHNIIVPNREEDIPVFEKLSKNAKKER